MKISLGRVRNAKIVREKCVAFMRDETLIQASRNLKPVQSHNDDNFYAYNRSASAYRAF